ncbi:MAG: preprotein translocase subunit SecG [Gammaproteobacteria bacterium]|nr:preprotein translocase subunit SecG [Gammaproteobacteria bacterium]
MQEVLLIIFLVVAIALVGVILLQQGKGAGMGASFGAGASGTVFGAPGSGNVLTKLTTVLAIIFFGIALTLGYLANDSDGETPKDIFDQAAQQQIEAAEKAKTDIPTTSTPDAESDIPAASKPEGQTDDVKSVDETNSADSKEPTAANEETADTSADKESEEGDGQ